MGISPAKARFLEETQNRRHGQNIRKLKSEHYKQYKDEVKKNKIQIGEIRDNYENQVNRLEMELEGKLAAIRTKHREMLKKERVRLAQELETLQGSYEKKKEELEMNQQEEFERMQRKHLKVIKDAENKAARERHRVSLIHS